MELKHLTRDAIRELLMIIFEGQRLHEESYRPPDQADARSGYYERDELDCYTEAAGGDAVLGQLAHVFDEWSNNVQELATHYGIGWLKDGTFSTDLPPAPSSDHWWNEGEWIAPEDLPWTEPER